MSASLPRLNRNLHPTARHPLRVVQFGSGVFLRGFVDWMLDELRRQGLFDGSVTVLTSKNLERLRMLEDQDGLYTLRLRGHLKGRVVDTSQVIEVIEGCLCPEEDPDGFFALARQGTLQTIVSNTTEAGIVWQEDCRFEDRPAASFPARLTQFLHHRYGHFSGSPQAALQILPCELIEENGKTLQKLVLRHADRWQLEASFCRWIKEDCRFHDTLVDRIVTGRPEEAMPAIEAKLGYRDALYNTAEAFHFWAIEGPTLQGLPLDKAGLNVLFTRDLRPYRERKIRILNGTHTLLFALALLLGQKTVQETLDDPDFSSFLQQTLKREILPFVPGDARENADYAQSVLERFQNEALSHSWQAIALQATAKFKARLLPSLLDHVKAKKEAPPGLCLALAALCLLYRGEASRPEDEKNVSTFMRQAWQDHGQDPDFLPAFTRKVLQQKSLWGQDLTLLDELEPVVTASLQKLMRGDIRKEVRRLGQKEN